MTTASRALWVPPRVAAERTVVITPAAGRVLTWMCVGADRRGLAGRLGVAPSTAANMTTGLLRALGARDRAQAVGDVLTGRTVVYLQERPRSTHERFCGACGKRYVARHPGGRFCSGACRVRARSAVSRSAGS